MCLSIDPCIIINKKLLGKPNSKGLYSEYKVFRRGFSDKLRITSPYKYHVWTAGWNFSDRVNSTVTYKELKDCSITSGFHIFVNRSSAKQEANDWGSEDHFTRKVWFNLEDVVATGTFCSDKNIVVTKLYARFD